MSFSCPHFDMDHEFCMKVRNSCVPGQPGCVLRHNSVFAVPVEERLAEQKTPNKQELRS
ncbi:MAG: hypothetical protein HUU20_29070 [Pirellulales bacterium]|nr:hypothetical protein [Pirellulales bacterium]